MDDTQSNRTSEAAATRKRRSSILKNQRPSRTPFSELEFNVATPTDTAKSRRVSFSRRTGVAEFVTNEATNTWKTIYVEQNKSLESSGNDSIMNQPHQTVGCLGKRIFDQQFEEIEVVDYGGNIITTDNMILQQMNMSMNVNFTQQIASLENDLDERKLAVPQQNFELSALTDHKSNLFGDDFAITTGGDVSNKIDINFSTIQPVGLSNDKYDDLDEIQKAVLMSEPKNFQGPFMDRRNISEYTEVDLNTTHIGMKNDDFDMSITDTIHSPKVQEVSKSNMSAKSDKKCDIDNDWIADKENIAINPYIAPKESANFAINEIPDQVLVFDGRKLTVQSEKNVTYNKDDQNFSKINMPNYESSGPPPHRKTFVLNINDDLPNFVTGTPLHGQIHGLSTNRLADKCEDNVNNEVLSKQNIQRRSGLLPNIHNTIFYDSGDIANISVTQAIPTNILGKSEKRKTIVFENETGNLSMTQVVPTNVVMTSNETQTNKTVLYVEDDISFTQAVPLNAFYNKTKNEENSKLPAQNVFDVSFTQAVPNNLVISNQTNKRNTIVFENDSNDISITRVLPSNILNCEKQIELPVVVKNNSIGEKEKEQILSEKNRLCNVVDHYGSQDVTKLNDKDQCHISETRILPTNIIESNKAILKDTAELKNNYAGLSITNENLGTNMSMSITEAIPDKIFYNEEIINDKTKIFNGVNEICDISVTQVLPSNIITDPGKKCLIQELENISTDNRDVVVENIAKIQRYPENVAGLNDYHTSTMNKPRCDSDLQTENIFTACSSSNKNQLNKTNTVELNISIKAANECTKVYKGHVDMSITQIVHPNDTLHNRNDVTKRETIVNDDDKNDISVETNILIDDIRSEKHTKPLFDEKDNNRENLTSISVCNCMVITSKQPCQIHICAHSNFSISADITENHTTNKQSEEQCEKSEAASDEANLPNICVIKNKPPILEENEILLKSMDYLDDIVQNLETSSLKSVTDHNYQDVFVYQAVTSHNVSKHQVGRIEQDEEVIEHTTNKESKKSSADINRLDQCFGKLLKNKTLIDKKVENKDIKKSNKKQKLNSFLSKLLNMSNESINLSSDGIDDKNIMAVIESQTAIETAEKNKLETNQLIAKPPEADCEVKEESTGTKSCLYQKKEIDNCTRADNLNEKSINSNSDNISKKSLKIVESKTESENKYSKEADNTNNLLEMLSDFTDKTMQKHSHLDEDSSDLKEVKDHIKTEQSSHHVTTEEKADPNDLKRLSVTKSRVSVMISREDLLNNISRVQAVLEQADDMDDSEMFNCTNNTTVEEPDEIVEEPNRRSRQGPVSAEVVKTLQFDDSNIDVISKSDSNFSPLKKTALCNISSLKDGKGKVIPPYLMDVSDDIKSLMKDLVKPAADVMPFETGVDKIIDKTPKEHASTNSIEIQANIITSSQIDLDIDSDLVSDCNSFGPRKMNAGDKIRPFTAAANPKLGISDGANGTENISNNFRKNVLPKPYLVFDHANPLNNVILSPSGTTEVHNYRPLNTVNSKSVSETAIHVKKAMSEHSRKSSFSERDEKDEERVQLVSTHYNVKIDPIRSDKQTDDSSNKKMAGADVVAVSCEEKPIPNYVNDDQKSIKDTEVNTSIAMRSNHDLLQSSSSLTIVDEDIAEVVIVEEEIVVNSGKKSKKTSPVKVIFKLDDQNTENSELSELSDSDNVKAKKRIYSPAKYDHQRKVIPHGPDTTPKPCNKMQKFSTSPFKSHINRASTAKINQTSVVEHVAFGSEKSYSKNSATKKSPKSLTTNSKPRSSIIVQRMITEFDINNGKGTKDLRMYGNVDSQTSSSSTLKTETISQKDFSSTHTTVSFMSNVAMKVADCMPSSITTTTSEGAGSINSDLCQMDYPEDQDFNEGAEIECGANVISKIDKLPFIGTRECEWDHSELDSWRFLLMRKELRLTVRLRCEPCARAQTHGDQRRRCVHDDAPVEGTAVDHVHEEADAVAATCTRLASEAMRYECVRGAALAGDVPALLRRCVAVARVARRWARAMREARVHLAYSLADSGRLVLKVANIPLRTVYEVTMRIELVVEDAREAAWARAGHVTLRNVTDDQGEKGEFDGAAGQKKRGHAADGGREVARGHDADSTREEAERWMPDVHRIVARVPHDWGHVPRTLWKVFRCLKNKTKDDPLGV